MTRKATRSKKSRPNGTHSRWAVVRAKAARQNAFTDSQKGNYSTSCLHREPAPELCKIFRPGLRMPISLICILLSLKRCLAVMAYCLLTPEAT